MPGVSAEQNVFSGPVCNESTFETQNVHSPRRSFYEEQQPEFHSHCLQQVPLTNMDQVHNFNFFSDSTNSEKCTPRITKDASVTAHKLFGKSLSLGAKICFPDDFSSVDSNGHFSEAFLSNPASFLEVKDNNPMLNARNGPVFESQDSITALHKFLPSNNEDEASWPGVDAYSCDEFRMYEFKVRRCTRGRSHDWTECPFAHPGEKARRRDPRRFHYSGTGCPDFRKGSCRRGDACEFAHGVFECWLHPARYRTQPCKDGRNCRRRVCFFAHTPEQLRLLPGASQTTNLGSRNLLQRNSVSGSYDGSPLRYAVSAAASFDGAFGYEGGTNCMLFDGNSSNSNSSAASPRGGNPCGHLGYLCKPNTSQTSSPTSTLVGHSHSPPPLSPPLSPSGSPPLSPDSPNWLNSVSYASPSGYQKAAVKNVVPASYASLAAGYHNSSNVAATLGLNSPVAGHRRQVEKMGSIPTLTIPNMDTRGISSPVSPAADCFSVNQSTKLMGDVINSLQHLELGSAPMWLQQQQHQSSQLGVAHGSPRAASNLRHSSVSLPCTPNKTRWETRFENWEAVENDDGLQRVESGRDLRAKIYGREKGLRVDGRCLNEVRPLFCESGSFPALHGSSVFSRGNTQVMCTVTLGAPADAQRLESLVGPPRKRFMVHYSFPPFSINEIGKQVGLSRREVGHGTLAEKALLALLPPEDEFPYSVRVNSEVMASDGSSSMATVCGGSLALMDAGVPLREHVAGVSVGLITEVDTSTGDVKDYRILTDILGLEDHLGDMDFKIAGTRKGVTAVQLDIKPAGIPLHILCECLDPALEARTHILDFMEQEIKVPREQAKGNSPRLVTVRLNRDYLSRLIGPQGSHLKKIEQETGARITVNFDGAVTILAKDQPSLEQTQEKVDSIVGREIEVGGLYKGVIVAIKDFGAFVEFSGGQQGLLHISELSHDQVSRVSDVVSVGQQLSLMCIGRDLRGNVKLSLKATLPQPKSELPNIDVEESELPVMEGSSSTFSSAAYMVTVKDSDTTSVSTNEKQTSDITEVSRWGVGDQQTDATSLYSSPSVLIRSADECDAKGSSEEVVQTKKNKQARKQSPGRSTFRDQRQLELQKKSKVTCTFETKSSAEYEKPVMVGDSYTVNVHQIRAYGLVLQVASGVRGMLRFESGQRNKFEVGEELQVLCTSMNNKGIPVFSLLEKR